MARSKKEDAAQLTEAAPEADQSVTVKSGSTFWDWLSDDHPRLRILLIAAIIAAILWLLFSLNGLFFIAASVSLFVALVVGFFMFRHEYFFNNSVVLIAFGSDDLTECNIYVIGKEKFRELDHDGNILSFNSASGDPIYIADYFDGETIHYPWSFETSRIKFILMADTFDDVKERCEAAVKENFKLHNIPRILGIDEARAYVRNYDDVLSNILSGGASPQPPEASSEPSQEGDPHD